ncbi:metacaspase-9 [Iris pallida]|uniref:Metacaspase-9 n=1 Tax=Iris pallida TaxID=29817 RepID=A0AAX6EFS4_IRIPA|nr:metacaspase-9 [Iris pallida]
MEAGKKRLATLVGCNYFDTRNELRGCINDVDSMRGLLVGRFGFRPEDVAVITDEPGSEVLPTGKNIRAALRSMADRAEPGDVLFFHFSGHGTLVPAVEPHHHGRSRRDEAIVPVDFNLITDVDFRQLVDRLPPGVSFTIISDSCHSGGLIDQEKEQIGPNSAASARAAAPPPDDRRRSRGASRTLPCEDILQHVSSLSAVESEHVGDHLLDIFGGDASAKYFSRSTSTPEPPADAVGADDGILLSGCQTNETSADMGPGEEEGEDGKACGAFSNSVRLVLGEQEEGGMSNRELVLRARKLLRERGFEQHPCLYCSDENADAPFLWQQQGEQL